jgi:hypothetical protein
LCSFFAFTVDKSVAVLYCYIIKQTEDVMNNAKKKTKVIGQAVMVDSLGNSHRVTVLDNGAVRYGVRGFGDSYLLHSNASLTDSCGNELVKDFVYDLFSLVSIGKSVSQAMAMARGSLYRDGWKDIAV